MTHVAYDPRASERVRVCHIIRNSIGGHFHIGNAKKWAAPVWFVSWRIGWNPLFRDFVWNRSQFRLTRRYFYLSIQRIL